jgi:hypothetical protein
MTTTIKCSNCGQEIEIDKALEGQIEQRVLAAAEHRHEEELEKVRAEAEAKAKKTVDAITEQAHREAADDLEIAKRQLEAELEAKQKRSNLDQELLVKQLRDDAKSANEQNDKLRDQLTELMKSLREEKEARANAEIEAQKKADAQADKIREDARKSADEQNQFKFLELEKQLQDARKVNADMQRKLDQGSQQTQGEVLELDLENHLREEFPYDEITEVKKGQRGADIVQIVRNQSAANCGSILWETKNGKWQPAWVPKFKQDIREANANIGVIVSQEMPEEIGDLKQIDGNVWAVCPKLATRLAVALRVTILQVDAANKMNAGKDAKMEALYQFLVGPEFRHRVEAIVENYTTLQVEIEKEKRAAALRWSHQEKAIRAVIDNTIGMYGDLQGITNRALPAIKTLELPEPVDDENDLAPETTT